MCQNKYGKTKKITNNKTMEKLKMVAGKRILQNGTCGSIVFVTTLTCSRLTWDSLAKYCGLGCSSCTSNPVKSHRCVISAEYLFHNSKNNVAKTIFEKLFHAFL